MMNNANDRQLKNPMKRMKSTVNKAIKNFMTKQKKNRILISIVTAVLLCSAPSAAMANTGQDIVILHPGTAQIQINTDTTTIEAIPYIQKDTTMVPLRFLCQDILKATVQWDSKTKGITITSTEQSVYIDTISGKITANQQEYTPALPPTVKNNYTFVPLRMLSEIFGCTVHYEGITQTITVVTPLPKVTAKPVALVTLPQNWTPGQELTITDQSTDPSGLAITEKVWTVNINGQSKEVTNLARALSAVAEGSYSLTYKVKNAAGVWSDAFITSLYVIPNTPPVITSLTNNTTKVAIGQPLELTFQVENESWEAIKGYRWSYGYIENGLEVIKTEKPRAFFAAGDVTVYLTATDAFGNTSEKYALPIHISNTVKATEKSFKFNNPLAGELFLNLEGQNYNNVPTASHTGGQVGEVTLLASNNPEKVSAYGILYQDSVSNHARIYFHHRNTTGKPLQIRAVAYNSSNEPVTITNDKSGLAGPSEDANQVGMQVVYNYLLATVANTSTILQPGETIVLNAGQSSLDDEKILTGLLDINCSSAVDIMIVAAPVGSTMADWQSYPVLPKEGSYVRGIFYNADINIDVIASGKEIEKVPIGRSDAYNGYFIGGYDATTGNVLFNYGNWGVLHTITITAKEKTGVWLNPRGSIYRGVLLWGDQVCMLANSGLLFGSREGVILGTIEKGQSQTITYMVPGGSDSPILLVLEPESQW